VATGSGYQHISRAEGSCSVSGVAGSDPAWRRAVLSPQPPSLPECLELRQVRVRGGGLPDIGPCRSTSHRRRPLRRRGRRDKSSVLLPLRRLRLCGCGGEFGGGGHRRHRGHRHRRHGWPQGPSPSWQALLRSPNGSACVHAVFPIDGVCGRVVEVGYARRAPPVPYCLASACDTGGG
jgi:hypothetical protein